jgi:hypothetical protein
MFDLAVEGANSVQEDGYTGDGAPVSTRAEEASVSVPASTGETWSDGNGAARAPETIVILPKPSADGTVGTAAESMATAVRDLPGSERKDDAGRAREEARIAKLRMLAGADAPWRTQANASPRRVLALLG